MADTSFIRPLPYIGKLFQFLHKLARKAPNSHPAPTNMSPSARIAKDIGLSPQEYARLTRELPSETNVHPRW